MGISTEVKSYLAEYRKDKREAQKLNRRLAAYEKAQQREATARARLAESIAAHYRITEG